MEVYLRRAERKDAELLFEWANEASVRRNSFSTEEISWEEHKAWYDRILASKDYVQYIYMCDGEAVGQVRIALKGETAEIGYSICKDKRAMGHGKRMLNLLYSKIREEFPKIKRLTAKVKPENTASQKVFEDLGYMEQYREYQVEVNE